MKTSISFFGALILGLASISASADPLFQKAHCEEKEDAVLGVSDGNKIDIKYEGEDAKGALYYLNTSVKNQTYRGADVYLVPKANGSYFIEPKDMNDPAIVGGFAFNPGKSNADSWGSYNSPRSYGTLQYECSYE